MFSTTFELPEEDKELSNYIQSLIDKENDARGYIQGKWILVQKDISNKKAGFCFIARYESKIGSVVCFKEMYDSHGNCFGEGYVEMQFLKNAPKENICEMLSIAAKKRNLVGPFYYNEEDDELYSDYLNIVVYSRDGWCLNQEPKEKEKKK